MFPAYFGSARQSQSRNTFVHLLRKHGHFNEVPPTIEGYSLEVNTAPPGNDQVSFAPNFHSPCEALRLPKL